MEGIILTPNRSSEFGLDPENFRIDSRGWPEWRTPNGILVRGDEYGRVTELIEGEYAGEQLFTLEAALEETSKAGKRVPSPTQWNAILTSIRPDLDTEGDWQDDGSVSAALGFRLAGYRDMTSGAHYYQDGYGYFWADASPKSSPYYGICVSVSRYQIRPAARCFRYFGYSVRCLVAWRPQNLPRASEPTFLPESGEAFLFLAAGATAENRTNSVRQLYGKRIVYIPKSTCRNRNPDYPDPRTPTGTVDYVVVITSTQVNPAYSTHYRGYGLSVRCLAN